MVNLRIFLVINIDKIWFIYYILSTECFEKNIEVDPLHANWLCLLFFRMLSQQQQQKKKNKKRVAK